MILIEKSIFTQAQLTRNQKEQKEKLPTFYFWLHLFPR